MEKFSCVLIGTKSFFCVHSSGCQFESYAAHRTPALSDVCCKKQQQKTPRAQQYPSSLVTPCAHGKLNVKHHRTPRNRRYTHRHHSREIRSRAGQKIDHQNVHRRRSSRGASIYIRVYTSKADFHKPGIYGGIVRVRAIAWDACRRTPSRSCRCRRAVGLFRGDVF